jgi:ethanolamine kinase
MVRTCSSSDRLKLLKLARHAPGWSQEEIDKDSILMRAYGNGTHVLIDRDREATSHLVCAKHGLAPDLLARFRNGLLYRYIPGDVCTPNDLIKEQVWRPVASGLGKWHATLPIDAVSTMNGVDSSQQNGDSDGISARKPSPNIWTVMRRWVHALPNDNPKQQARRKFLEQELDRSFADLDNTNGPGQHGFVFGHCVSLSDLPCAAALSRHRSPVPACLGRYGVTAPPVLSHVSSM